MSLQTLPWYEPLLRKVLVLVVVVVVVVVVVGRSV